MKTDKNREIAFICNYDVEEIINSERLLIEMATRLGELNADKSASKTIEIIKVIRDTKNRVDAAVTDLYKVWKAVDEFDEFNIGEKNLKQVLTNYEKT
jgi:NifU-like protein involved in Fe-S cluster formation